jgi:3-hydroxyisobutyrate dehydrogenase-like beta-hydroxyacid dehydrogenase
VVVVMATVAPDDVRRLGAAAEERRLALLDAALTGGVSGAEAGTLTAMVGGTDEALAACRPCFDATCGRVFHLGALGAGMTMKALNQMVFAGTFTALCEMAAVATRAGVDLKTAFEVLGTGVCDSWVLRSRAPAFVDGSYSTGARTAVLRKDLAIAQALARSVSQPIPVTATATQMFELAAGMGYDDTDDAHLLRALLGYRRE